MVLDRSRRVEVEERNEAVIFDHPPQAGLGVDLPRHAPSPSDVSEPASGLFLETDDRHGDVGILATLQPTKTNGVLNMVGVSRLLLPCCAYNQRARISDPATEISAVVRAPGQLTSQIKGRLCLIFTCLLSGGRPG